MKMQPHNENIALAALINLLDEPDENAFRLIREKIRSLGMEAIGPLENAWENNFDPMVQDRIQDIIRQLQRENLYSEFLNWVKHDASDLLKGFIMVTKTQYPSLDEQEIIAKIEQLRIEIWLELHENLTALENIKVLNRILFDVHHFEGNNAHISIPRNSYINTFLESKKGSPLSLGILYMILARKLELPVYGVNLPQHFILAYLTDLGLENPSEEDVLFYINPYHQGAVFTRREIELFIRQMKIKPESSFFSPCSNLDIIQRLISSLVFSYNQLGYPDKIEDLDNLLNAFL